ncbi:hypothetical protein [Agromyces larvae]|uniref:Uncharacterized protein n=1 Tax=Agromyces larvae TaxID=2929802 RepID=A0ABY4C2Y1_9MICO|nr:hypothetical protein [Agromyces larvae]UOE45679.1 hypothetical protein MTO99_08000 [Agromyces larvae]
MIDETASSDRDETTRQQVSVLYDPKTGRAVHGHTFVGIDDDLSAPGGAAARERVLREAAGGSGGVDGVGDVGRLRFADAPARLGAVGPAELRVEEGVVVARPLRVMRRKVDLDVLRRHLTG